MHWIYIWLIAYAVPVALSQLVIKYWRKAAEPKFYAATVHLAVIISIILCQFFIRAEGAAFPWRTNYFGIIFYGAGLLFALVLIGWLGALYGLSAWVQQLAIQSINFYLLLHVPVYAAILLIVPLYVWAHRAQSKHRRLRIILFSIWGAASVLIFAIYPNFYLIAGLHAIFGGFLVAKSVLYTPESITQ